MNITDDEIQRDAAKRKQIKREIRSWRAKASSKASKTDIFRKRRRSSGSAYSRQ